MNRKHDLVQRLWTREDVLFAVKHNFNFKIWMEREEGVVVEGLVRWSG